MSRVKIIPPITAEETNPLIDLVVICAIRVKDGKQLLNYAMKEEDFNETELIRVINEKKEPSKVIAIGSDIVHGSADILKATAMGFSNIRNRIAEYTSSVKEGVKENARAWDKRKTTE